MLRRHRNLPSGGFETFDHTKEEYIPNHYFYDALDTFESPERKLFFIFTEDFLDCTYNPYREGGSPIRSEPLEGEHLTLHSLCMDAFYEIEAEVELFESIETRIGYLKQFLRDYRFEGSSKLDPSRDDFEYLPLRKFYREVTILLDNYEREPEVITKTVEDSRENGWQHLARAAYLIGKASPDGVGELRELYVENARAEGLTNETSPTKWSLTKEIKRLGRAKLEHDNLLDTDFLENNGEQALPDAYHGWTGVKRLIFQLMRGKLVLNEDEEDF